MRFVGLRFRLLCLVGLLYDGAWCKLLFAGLVLRS